MAGKNSLRIQKRLLQFNNISFTFGEITSASYSATFKGEVQTYTNAAHGSYYPSIGQFQNLETSTFEAEIDFDFSEIDCDEKVRYARFIKRHLAKSGKLFATQYGTQLIWTNARVVAINEVLENISETDMLRLNVTFELIDGYWRLCSRTKTFLCKYCPAQFMNYDEYYCFDTSELVGRCGENGAIKCLPCDVNLYEEPLFKNCDPTPLCNYSQNELEDMFGRQCANRYHIEYSCELESKYFCYDVSWGKKFHLRSDQTHNYQEIQFCSQTDLPTEFVRVRLAGDFENVSIDINGDYVRVPDDQKTNDYSFKGILSFGYGPEVYYSKGNLEDPLNKNKWGYSDIEYWTDRFEYSNIPYFRVKPGLNTVKISGAKYLGDAYLYIDPVEITY